MTEMSCLHCQATTSNGLALCDLCQRKATVVLEFLPIYFRNLARWRPGRAGSRPVPGSRVLYDGEFRGDGTGDRISDRLDEAANALTTRARELVDDRPHLARLLDRLADARRAERIDEAQAVAWLCKGFERHLTTVATLGWCGDFVRDLDYHESILRGLTEASIPGWYAGGCRRQVSMEAKCGAATYVVPGLTWVTCGQCGATTYARDHLEAILNEARPWVARPMRLAEAIVALVDTELSVVRLYERIKKWEQRDKIIGIRRLDRDGDEVGPKSYRFGEVLDLLFDEGATRLTGIDAQAS
jgi:hypothetical protein